MTFDQRLKITSIHWIRIMTSFFDEKTGYQNPLKDKILTIFISSIPNVLYKRQKFIAILTISNWTNSFKTFLYFNSKNIKMKFAAFLIVSCLCVYASCAKETVWGNTNPNTGIRDIGTENINVPSTIWTVKTHKFTFPRVSQGKFHTIFYLNFSCNFKRSLLTKYTFIS